MTDWTTEYLLGELRELQINASADELRWKARAKQAEARALEAEARIKELEKEAKAYMKALAKKLRKRINKTGLLK